VQYNLPQRIGHKDGWIIVNHLGYPIHNGWSDTRDEARKTVRDFALTHVRIVRARSIVVWKKA